jgi:hypothetical protein
LIDSLPYEAVSEDPVEEVQVIDPKEVKNSDEDESQIKLKL